MAVSPPPSVARDGATARFQLVELVPAAANPVGSVVRFRKGFGYDSGFVIGQLREGWVVEILRANGETVPVPISKIKETMTEPGPDVRSAIGRLMNYLHDDVRFARSEAQADVVRARVDQMKGVRENAVALLLDRRPLGLSLSDCLALPVEPWRVRYEFLIGATDEEARGIVSELLADPTTPSSVRAVVALKFSRPPADGGPLVESLFGSDGRVDAISLSAVEASATALSEELAALGVAGHSNLQAAVQSPTDLAGSSRAAAILAALNRTYPSGQVVDVDATTPTPILDDLLDARVRVAVATDESGAPIDPSLQSYVVARTDPAGLSSGEVVSLGFGDEALRRYLAGDTSVEAALPAGVADDVKAYRDAVTAGDGSAAINDPRLRELRDVVVAKGAVAPSEALLADQSVWQELIRAGVPGSSGTGPLGERFAGVSALNRAATALYEWRWDDARAAAREGLREARAEDVRDELLNIVACALWLSGEPEPALAALDNALEGQYSDALLINASVVATELEHESAIDRFVKLAREAPNAHQRAVAAERALILWDNDDARIWEDDDVESLPNEIRDALRPLIRESLPEDRYLRVLRVLANRDDDWLAGQPDGAFGANAGTAPVRVFRARAAGLDKYVEALAAELALRPGHAASAPEWVSQERDGMVEAAIQVLFERNDELAAAFFGLTLIDANLPMSAEQRVPLKCLTVASITANLDPEESEPNLRFIDLVAEAHQELSDVDHSDRARLSGLVEIAAERLARSYFISRYRQFDEVLDAYNVMMARIGGIPARNLNRQAVREAFGPISAFCTDTYDIFKRLRPFIDDAKLEEAVDSMMRQSSDMGDRIAAVTR